MQIGKVMGMREKLMDIVCESIATDRCVAYCSHPHCGLVQMVVRKLIASGVTIQKWIPVAEPPKGRGLYFVTVRHWLDGKPVTREAYWNSEDWLSPERRHELTPRVTHWMPLPEAPNGERRTDGRS